MRSPVPERPAVELLRAFTSCLDQVGGALTGGFSSEIETVMDERELVPNTLPCLGYLPRAATIAGDAERELAELLLRHAPVLRWGQTYSATDFGQRFLDNYSWMELFGLRGHLKAPGLPAVSCCLGRMSSIPIIITKPRKSMCRSPAARCGGRARERSPLARRAR